MKGVGWVEKVEADLNSELAMIGDADSQVQLGPHRTAFDKLLKEFKHVKPLLVKIKHAYDTALADSQQVAAEVGPLQSKVATVAEDCERKILQIKQGERDDINATKDMNKNLKKEIGNQKLEILDLQAKVDKLVDEMGILNHKYRDEKYARRLLIADMNDQQMIEKSHDKIEPDDLDDDPSSDIDLTEATQTIAKLKSDQEEIQEKLNKCENERDEALKNLSQLQSEFNILKSTYEQVAAERNEAVAKNSLTNTTPTTSEENNKE